MSEQQAVGVVGAGPVGSTLAAFLSARGHPVLLVERLVQQLAAIRAHGLRVQGALTTEAPLPELSHTLRALSRRPLATLFVCTKTWALRDMLPELARVLGPQTVVVSVQNGIGPEEELAAVLGRERVLRAMINFAAGLGAPGQVTTRWLDPPNLVGPLAAECRDSAEQVARLLSQAGLPTRALPACETRREVFHRTILSCGLNALCAMGEITMQQAMSFPHTRQQARQLMAEGFAVARALGHDLGHEALERAMSYLDQGGEHRPSMWTDLRRGTRTEVEHINGKIVELSRALDGVEAPLNAFFTAAVVTRELASGARDPNDIPAYLLG